MEEVTQKINMLIFTNHYLNSLLNGMGSIISTNNNIELNRIALYIYEKEVLDNTEQDILKDILSISNILYNRTDMQVLPIDDGFYDLLLEKYKQYDNHFQVGSYIVDLKNIQQESMMKDGIKEAEIPIIIREPIKRNEIREQIHDEFMKVQKIDIKDFSECPVTFIPKDLKKGIHDTSHNHPDLVGTLDKCKFVLNKDAKEAGAFNDPNVKVLERDFFEDHIKKGILDPSKEIEIICELKYDGISVEADCGLEVVSARTRGDTGIGKAVDISPILQGYTFKRAGVMIGEEPLGVKFEAIMTKSNLEKYNQLRQTNYANCRTAISGLFGLLDGYKYRDFITLVPLSIDRMQVPEVSNRLEEINFINTIFSSHGEPLRYCYFSGSLSEILYYIKAFLQEAQIARDYLNFMYDGIVVSYLDENIRARLGRENYINKYSMAVKFDPIERFTNFTGYTFEVGQHGTITPIIHYNPVEFIGTIHTKSTGSSYKRFKELGLRYGDLVSVKYVNDVMPYVTKVECDFNRKNTNPVIEFPKLCPICGSEIVILDSGNSAICPNEECPARTIKRLSNMLQKLNLKGFAESTIASLKCSHLYEICELSEEQCVEIIGIGNGTKFYKSIMELKSNPIPDYFVLGALGFTSIAHRKWKDILSEISVIELISAYENNCMIDSLISSMPKLADTVTLSTIVNQFGFFYEDIKYIYTHFHLIDSKSMNSDVKGVIRFTGCRNIQLSERLINAGYDADGNGSVTKKTNILLIPYEGFSSTKINKVSPNCQIIPIQEFEDNMEKYIGEKV